MAASAMEKAKPAMNSVVPSWSSAASSRSSSCCSLAARASIDFNCSSIACMLLSLEWYLLARSGFLAILAITTLLLNLLKNRSNLSGTWLNVKGLLSHSSTFWTHSCTRSRLILLSPSGSLMLSIYLQHRHWENHLVVSDCMLVLQTSKNYSEVEYHLKC